MISEVTRREVDFLLVLREALLTLPLGKRLLIVLLFSKWHSYWNSDFLLSQGGPQRVHNVIPVLIRDILAHKDEKLVIEGTEVQMVGNLKRLFHVFITWKYGNNLQATLIGVVDKIDSKSSNITYTIRDDTGIIEVVQWNEGEGVSNLYFVSLSLRGYNEGMLNFIEPRTTYSSDGEYLLQSDRIYPHDAEQAPHNGFSGCSRVKCQWNHVTSARNSVHQIETEADQQCHGMRNWIWV